MSNVLLLFLGFQLKHLIIDFFLQGQYQYKNKGTYGHFGGILHSALHAIGTFGLLSLVDTIPGIVAVVLSLFEGLVHYHIDYLKVQYTKKCQWSELDAENKCLKIFSNKYFLAIGVDQFLHQVTYIVIIGFIVLLV